MKGKRMFVAIAVTGVVLIGTTGVAEAKTKKPTLTACTWAAYGYAVPNPTTNDDPNLQAVELAVNTLRNDHEGEFPKRLEARFTDQMDVTDAHSGLGTYVAYCNRTYPRYKFTSLSSVKKIRGSASVAALMATAATPTTTTAPPTTTVYTPPMVTYEVTGDGSASLTIQNQSGGTEQFDAPLPWSRTFPRGADSFVYVSAQQDGSGTVACKITYQGRVIQEASSNGDYVIASCSGSL